MPAWKGITVLFWQMMLRSIGSYLQFSSSALGSLSRQLFLKSPPLLWWKELLLEARFFGKFSWTPSMVTEQAPWKSSSHSTCDWTVASMDCVIMVPKWVTCKTLLLVCFACEKPFSGSLDSALWVAWNHPGIFLLEQAQSFSLFSLSNPTRPSTVSGDLRH